MSTLDLLQDIETDLEESQAMFSFVLNGPLTLVCVISGFVLNLLCIYIFLKYRNGGTPVIHYYLVTLTAWQTALLCNAFLLYCLPTILWSQVVSRGNYVYLYPYAYVLANTTHTGSVWIILTLTVDRYLALCKPLTHRAIGKRSRVKRLMIGVSVMAIVFSIPRFFEVATAYDCSLEASGQCEPVVVRTALTEDKTYWTVYHIVLPMAFVTLLPCLLLLALTTRISLALRKAIVQRKRLCQPNLEVGPKAENTTSTSKEHKANVMLVLVIAKFLISDILPTVVDVLEHLVGNEVFMSSSLATLFVDFSNFLLVLNCSTNFWVFLLWGTRFRRSCAYLIFGSSFGRVLCRWLRVAFNSDLPSCIVQPSSPNCTKARNYGYYSDASRKRSYMPGDSMLLYLSGENGTYVSDPLRKKSSTIGMPNSPSMGRVQRARSYAGTDIVCSTDSNERQRLLSVLAAQRR
ncbi:Protein FRPR-7 [Aphelenchoides avenae]|nr:Protein FRPR-7 [Aphelenchus avenae]